MNRSLARGTVMLVALATLWPLAARAQSSMHAHDSPPAAVAGAKAYSPGLGEIMTLQQMRHSKLWFAARARNWELAGYELDELNEGFDDVAKLFPTLDDVPLAPMVEAIKAKEIATLAKAIEAHDGAGFAGAFDRLTAACNACHQSAKHAFIRIQRPAGLPYTNQSFAPARQ